MFLFVLTPKNRVGMAFKKSSGAYASAMKKVVAFDYAAAAKKEAFSQELSVNFDSIPDLTLSRSLGLRLRVDANIPDEYFGADLALTAGAESLPPCVPPRMAISCTQARRSFLTAPTTASTPRRSARTSPQCR